MWSREQQRARLLNLKHLHCPWGRVQILVKTVRGHLFRYGRRPLFMVWRGPGKRDSSDEEWEEEFWASSATNPTTVDAQVVTREMLNDAFQFVDDDVDLQNRVQHEVLAASAAADSVHEEYSDGRSSSAHEGADPVDMEELTGDTNSVHEETDSGFDPEPLEGVLQQLYSGARATKLAATLLLMNLCTVHGVSNSFADEFFAILHSHLLPEENCLPKNYHAAKSLTRKLGLSYNSIHACAKGCVLFRGEHAEEISCPKCGESMYKDPARKIVPSEGPEAIPYYSQVAADVSKSCNFETYVMAF
jgi:hypothetical protein